MNAKTSSIITVLATIVAISGCVDSQPQDQSNSKLKVPVGEDAWEVPKKVNITDYVSPSNINLEDKEAIEWRNKNNFTVNISIQKVEKTLTVEPESSKIFRPTSSFDYEVKTVNETLGSGKIITN
jgi:hypothetical protein